ncbi:hypothetical protein ONZ51_g4501 [Trametes cubensis]|uniref:Uncharacterized protein n=1 Tax=Trametes cubensis TaxID=1111947 RepID=A0AAD7XBX4_9APHY|nr:hypothetical protein ONZ51_g4501 [Trametes cubensis]
MRQPATSRANDQQPIPDLADLSLSDGSSPSATPSPGPGSPSGTPSTPRRRWVRVRGQREPVCMIVPQVTVNVHINSPSAPVHVNAGYSGSGNLTTCPPLCDDPQPLGEISNTQPALTSPLVETEAQHPVTTSRGGGKVRAWDASRELTY